MTRFRLPLATALLVLALSPSLGAAQGEQRTHTVKKGDTLWDLAQAYLGDPFKWPDIYRLNTATVQDPNLIYPDQVLIISGDVVATPGTPADTSMPPMVPPTDTVANPDMPMDTSAQQQPQPEPELPPPSATIFNASRNRATDAGIARQSLQIRPRAGAVRSGDYLQAPFLWDGSGVGGAGHVDAVTVQDGIGLTPKDRPIQIYETVSLVIPQGSDGMPDERFLIFRYGPTIPGRGRVVVPTGVVKLSTASVNGRADGILLTKFEDVYSGHFAMALDTLTAAPNVFPTRVEFGMQTTVTYIAGNPVLPPVGHQLIFAAGAAEGIVPGDQITIQRAFGADAAGNALPPQDIAVAQVTRVTPWGASAILIQQSDAGVAVGAVARITAKMP